MCNIDVWFDIWRRDLIFSFVGIHVIDSGTSSALCGEVAHLSTIEAWPFGFMWLICLGRIYFVLSCIFFVILGSISSQLVWPVVELIPTVEAVVGKSGMSYVHWDWGIVVLSRHIRQVVLRVLFLCCVWFCPPLEEKGWHCLCCPNVF